MRKTLEQRFWEKVNKNGPVQPNMETECWVWCGATEVQNGYGQLAIGGGRWDRAHRVSYKINIGTVPLGKCVLHKCDNRMCVRPEHLYLGTKKDNAQDREQRNRANHATGERHGTFTHPGLHSGERNGRAKLTTTQVTDLLKEHKQGMTKAALARKYNLSKTAVGDIVSGKLWPNVER